MLEDPEMLWLMMLVSGPDRLGPEERQELAFWLIGNLPGRRAELMPATAEEAENLRLFAEDTLNRGMPSLAAPMAKMAVEAQERFCTAGDVRIAAALATAAYAFRLCLAREEVMPAAETNMFQARLMTISVDHGNAEPFFRVLMGYCRALTALKLYGEAEPTLRRALDLVRIVGGDDPACNVVVMLDLAVLLAAMGRYVEGEGAFREVCTILHAQTPANHSDFWDASIGLGLCLWHLGKVAEAEQAFVVARDHALEGFGVDSDRLKQAQQRLSSLAHARLEAETQGRPIAWALRQAREQNPFCDAVRVLLRLSDALGSARDAQRLAASAAELLAWGGRLEAAFDLVEERMPDALPDWAGATVYAEAVRAALKRGDADAARASLERGIAAAERSHGPAGDAGRRLGSLWQAVGQIDSPGISGIAAGLADAETWRDLIESELEANTHDVGRVQACLDAYAATELPDVQLLSQAGWVAAHGHDRDLAARSVTRLKALGSPELAVDVLLEMGELLEAEHLARDVAGGPARAYAFSVLARNGAERGDRERFDRYAALALAEGAELLSVTQLAVGLRSLAPRPQAEEWGTQHLSGTLRTDFMARLEVPRPFDPGSPVFADRPDITQAVQEGSWECAVELLDLLHDDTAVGVTIAEVAGKPTLRRVGNGYIDFVRARMLAESARHAGRLDIALQAFTFALSTVDGFMTGRTLGRAVREILPEDARRQFAEAAFATAAMRAGLWEGVELVAAAGYACLPSSIEP
ncbi:MAG: hypothetical protein AB7G39_17955 [Alphaproteobacteria bacterium]